MIRKMRIIFSRIATFSLIILISISRNGWEEISPFFTQILFLIGTVMVGIGTLGRLWCSLYIAGYKSNSLITEGPYSISRNPLYFFSFIGAIGVGLASETLLVTFIILVFFLLYYPHVIKAEENKLKELYGDKFTEYLNSVPSFFPNISLFKEPEEYVVKPTKFRKHIFDALWFVWVLGIMEIIEGLHESNILPMLLTIY